MPREMAIRGTHDWVIRVLSGIRDFKPGTRVLDIGAGEGALSARLQSAGWTVSACDFAPEQFQVPGLTCAPCDDTGTLPFADATFDLAVAVEVMEHIDGHDRFFAEAARVLKPGGQLVFTTPNILSLKSRLNFLLTGWYYSFGPLAPFTRDPVRQHVSPFTLNRYEWLLSQHDLRVQEVRADKRQNASLMLAWLIPVIWLTTWLRFGRGHPTRAQNATRVLLGRKLCVVARKGP